MIEISKNPIDLNKILEAVSDESAGGLVLFIGRTRNHANGKRVIRMEYEGYPKMARSALEKIANTVKTKWPVKKLAIVHRVGMLSPGEASVVIAIACSHRAQAFAACRYAIDRLKETVPIWKKEYGPDGSTWVEGIMPKINNTEEEM